MIIWTRLGRTNIWIEKILHARLFNRQKSIALIFRWRFIASIRAILIMILRVVHTLTDTFEHRSRRDALRLSRPWRQRKLKFRNWLFSVAWSQTYILGWGIVSCIFVIFLGGLSLLNFWLFVNQAGIFIKKLIGLKDDLSFGIDSYLFFECLGLHLQVFVFYILLELLS